MKNLMNLNVLGIAVLLALSSCSKQIETPFEIYFLSTDSEFPTETRLIFNSNYIGDVQKVDKGQLMALSEISPSLRTSVEKVNIRAINNAGTELSNITFSLLPDGTFKKASSSGPMNYQLKTIDRFRFAVLFDKP